MLNILDKSWITIGHHHENISPTWAASMEVSGLIIPAVTTPYYCNGNILDYVCHNPRAEKFDLVCQVISALAYIHSKGTVHGNICPVSQPYLVCPFSELVQMLKADAL
jgi:serine/threonine protein kinase